MPKRDETYMRGRRDHIVQAALGCIRAGGLANFSTTAVCKAAGISMGALYTHFATKEDILYALAEHSVAERANIYNFQTRREMNDRLLAIIDAVPSKNNQLGFKADMEILIASVADDRLLRLWGPRNASRDLRNSIERLSRVGELRGGLDADAAAFALEALIFAAAYRQLTGLDVTALAKASLMSLLETLAPDNAAPIELAAPSQRGN